MVRVVHNLSVEPIVEPAAARPIRIASLRLEDEVGVPMADTIERATEAELGLSRRLSC